jgi:hypothetical protein
MAAAMLNLSQCLTVSRQHNGCGAVCLRYYCLTLHAVSATPPSPLRSTAPSKHAILIQVLGQEMEMVVGGRGRGLNEKCYLHHEECLLGHELHPCEIRGF